MAQETVGQIVNKTIGITELKEKFIKLNQDLKGTNVNVSKIQNTLVQEQTKLQQILGALQITADMIVTLVGQEEAQRIINEIQGGTNG